MRRSTWGGALGSTLLVALLLVLFGLTLVNLATFDLRVVGRNAQKQLALNAAEAGLEFVSAELARDPGQGLSNETYTETLSDGSSYRITFDSTSIHPWSVNNLAELTGQGGYLGRTVPPLHALLFAEGTSPSGETALVECLISLDATPYAIAGTGRVNLSTVFVAGSATAAGAATSTAPGSVYSGSSDPNGIVLGGLTNVTGDVRSVGGVNQSPTATVGGDVEIGYSPETLPNLVISDFQNDTVVGVDSRAGGVHTEPNLSGQYYFDNDTTLLGPLTTMADATIYVDGDLTINTALVGTGTIFVNGETRFLTTINLAGSGNRLTLFSDGDVRMPTLPLPNIFQGVIYTHGDLITGPLLSTTVLGAVYAVGSSPGGGNVNMGTGSTVVHVSELTNFASPFLALGGEGTPQRVYWCRVR